MRTAKTLSDWVDAQADLSLRWAQSHLVGFVMLRLIQDCNLVFLHIFIADDACILHL